jgi:hypothetical protein
MPHRVSISRLAGALLVPSSKQVVRSLVIVCLLFTAGAAFSQSASPATPTPAQSATKQRGGAAPAQAPAPRALREAMAELLERGIGFRSRLSSAPRIHDAKFIGPIQRSTDLFRSPEAIYCVKAVVDFPLIPAHPVALLKVVTAEDGRQGIRARISITDTPFGCLRIKDYGPFPELEAARERRRRVEGIKD